MNNDSFIYITSTGFFRKNHTVCAGLPLILILYCIVLNSIDDQFQKIIYSCNGIYNCCTIVQISICIHFQKFTAMLVERLIHISYFLPIKLTILLGINKESIKLATYNLT